MVYVLEKSFDVSVLLGMRSLLRLSTARARSCFKGTLLYLLHLRKNQYCSKNNRIWKGQSSL